MVAQRLERMVQRVRLWRTGSATDPLTAPLRVSAELNEPDLATLRVAIDDCLDAKGGEIAARRRATAIGATFLKLDEGGRRNFFRLLADEYDHDDAEVDAAIAAVVESEDLEVRRSAEHHLAETLRPKRERLLRRFVGLDGGLPFLVDLREELLVHRRSDAAMAAVDADLRSLLEAWFDVALLQLTRLTWTESPAALLQKLIHYEAVHAIESWDDLQGRLGAGRRCYAFTHSMMPGEPLIFVEVALTSGIADSLEPLLDHQADRPDSASADTAIFYSISNCHRGLAGVSLGDFLIKKVVQEISNELPNITQFSTLSPIPGFRTWLVDSLASLGDWAANEDQLLTAEDAALLSSEKVELANKVLHDLVSSDQLPARVTLNPLEGLLTRLAAVYLVKIQRGDRAKDAVAHFHLSNGARVEQLNWWANPSKTGWERGLSLMVNYRYVLSDIEANHDRYVAEGHVRVADGIRRLLGD